MDNTSQEIPELVCIKKYRRSPQEDLHAKNKLCRIQQLGAPVEDLSIEICYYILSENKR